MKNDNRNSTKPVLLNNSSTKEIEEILNDKLNLIFAISRTGKVKRIYPNHFDQSSENNLQYDGDTTQLTIRTQIPKAEIEQEKNICKKVKAFFAYCPCGIGVGGRCRECDDR